MRRRKPLLPSTQADRVGRVRSEGLRAVKFRDRFFPQLETTCAYHRRATPSEADGELITAGATPFIPNPRENTVLERGGEG